MTCFFVTIYSSIYRWPDFAFKSAPFSPSIRHEPLQNKLRLQVDLFVKLLGTGTSAHQLYVSHTPSPSVRPHNARLHGLKRAQCQQKGSLKMPKRTLLLPQNAGYSIRIIHTYARIHTRLLHTQCCRQSIFIARTFIEIRYPGHCTD